MRDTNDSIINDTDTNDVDLGHAPLPTDSTIARRQNVGFQLLRFAAINLKMIRVIRRGHGEPPSLRPHP